ncbi:MAG: hypothetical protein ACD_39C01727G0004 [uncultured bacterium]|nr:MAG: hypothetical protein ACD_39C01727G0004 [uncultured bacterium]
MLGTVYSCLLKEKFVQLIDVRISFAWPIFVAMSVWYVAYTAASSKI